VQTVVEWSGGQFARKVEAPFATIADQHRRSPREERESSTRCTHLSRETTGC
jgi:hypothetical protein